MYTELVTIYRVLTDTLARHDLEESLEGQTYTDADALVEALECVRTVAQQEYSLPHPYQDNFPMPVRTTKV